MPLNHSRIKVSEHSAVKDFILWKHLSNCISALSSWEGWQKEDMNFLYKYSYHLIKKAVLIISSTEERRTLPPVLVADKEICSLGTLVVNGCIDFPDTAGEAQVLNGLGEPWVYSVATDSPVLAIYRKTENVVRILEESDLLFVKAPELSV